MNRIYRALLLIALSPLGFTGEARLNTSDLATVSTSIESVIPGGLWFRPDANGEYRLLVTRSDWAENTTNDVFVQWLRTDHQQHRYIVEHTAPVSELAGHLLAETPRHLATNEPRDFGQSFTITTTAETTFTLTPHPDHTYSITSRSLPPSFRRALLLAVGAFGCFGLGFLVSHVLRRNRNA